MATGDNVLTAISVGRQCNIIEADSEVFLGDVKKVGDQEYVTWTSTRGTTGHKINKGTLVPEPGFYEDEAKRQNQEFSNSKLSNIELSRQEDEKQVNDVIRLADFPWQHPPEEYAIALTGKAFNILLHDPRP